MVDLRVSLLHVVVRFPLIMTVNQLVVLQSIGVLDL